jgi:DNA-binding IscR family transcriptional regulator
MNIMVEAAAMIVTIIAAAVIGKNGGIMVTIEAVDMIEAVDTVIEVVTKVAIGGLPQVDALVKKGNREVREKIHTVLADIIIAVLAATDGTLRNRQVQKKLCHWGQRQI